MTAITSDTSHITIDPDDERVRGAPLGAVVHGVDLSETPGAADMATIEQALADHLVLVMPKQHLGPAAMVAFSRLLGPLEVHVLSDYHLPGFREVYSLTNVDADDRIVDSHPDKGTLVWHSGFSFTDRPASYTLLYGVETPGHGADTLYANMYMAYDTLEPALKARIDGAFAVHDLASSRRRAGADKDMTAGELAAVPPVRHPLVRRHPVTGRRSLYVGHHCVSIDDIDGIDGGGDIDDGGGGALLAALIDHATAPAHVYAHKWQPGDLVIWDNRCTLHKATPFDTAHERRVMYRTVIGGQATH